MARAFGHVACFDWSGAAVARPAGIALAVAARGDAAPRLVRPDGGWSRAAALEWLVAQADARRDIVVGIDFSAALPFVDRGAYLPGWADTPPDARALWAAVDRHAAADPHLAATGFVDHAEASRHFRRPGGREGDLFGGGGGRLRATERACRAAGLGAAQSGFNLIGAAQVGRASLTGMRLLHRLAGRIPVWPFDPVPAAGPLIVEIYTALPARAAGVRGGTKLRTGEALDAALAGLGSEPCGRRGPIDDHAADAILAAAWLRRTAGDDRLWAAPPAAIAGTEGWTFGVPCTMAGAAPA